MKKTMIPLILMGVGLLAGGTVSAVPAERYYDTAKVIEVTPTYQRVEITEPEEHCWKERAEYVEPERRPSAVGTITGAIIGGVVGNRFGHGRGRDLMTAASAVLGGAIGHDVSRRPYAREVSRVIRRCEVRERVRYEDRLAGYDVKYRYKGRVFVTHMKHRPGKRLRLRVVLRPQEPLRDQPRRHDHPPRYWDF